MEKKKKKELGFFCGFRLSYISCGIYLMQLLYNRVKINCIFLFYQSELNEN